MPRLVRTRAWPVRSSVSLCRAQGALEVVDGLSKPADLDVRGAEVGQRVCLPLGVVGVAGGVVGVTVDGQGVVVVSAVEVAEENGGQSSGVARPAVGGGARSGRDQGGAFAVQPVTG